MLRLSHISVLILVLCNVYAFGQVEQLKTEADAAYISEEHQKAAELYQQILDQEYVSAEVEYNLGNSYFKTGQIALSILHFERALKLAPSDEDIQFNLKLANLSVKDKVEDIPQLFFIQWWNQILKVFSTDGWAWNAVIAFLLGLIGFLLFRFSSEEGIRRLTFYVGIICIGWGAFSIYAAQKNFNHIVKDTRAVVFASTLNAKSAPDRKGKDLFVIHEGLVVTVTDEVNGWSRIKLSNGNVGWVPEGTIVNI
jgi:tetratricopeptide (TPR) repeat protein